jgi:hypothetical protein
VIVAVEQRQDRQQVGLLGPDGEHDLVGPAAVPIGDGLA